MVLQQNEDLVDYWLFWSHICVTVVLLYLWVQWKGISLNATPIVMSTLCLTKIFSTPVLLSFAVWWKGSPFPSFLALISTLRLRQSIAHFFGCVLQDNAEMLHFLYFLLWYLQYNPGTVVQILHCSIKQYRGEVCDF